MTNKLCFFLLIITKFVFTQTSLPCNNNIFCDPANAIPNDVYTNNTRSVVKITNSDNEDGTGTLLRQLYGGNDDNQQQNIIITARHVIHSGTSGFGPLTNLSQMKFYFNYSNGDCNTIPSPDPINEPKLNRYVITGATLIDEDVATDIAILKLNNPIPPHFKPYYSGWTAAPMIYSGKYFDIHHPRGDIKKISSTTGGLVNPNFPIPTRYNVTWVDGRTQEGSSGSALFNYNRRVVGAASFGFPGNENCTNTQYVNFGKFRNFWLGSPATRSALRPNNNNNPFIIGNSGGEIDCYSGPIYLDGKYWPAQDYQPTNLITIKCDGDMFLAHTGLPLTVKTGAEFTFEAGGQVIKALPGFHAELGSTVIIKPNMSCTAMRMANSFNPEDIDSSIVNYYYDAKIGEQPKETEFSKSEISTIEVFPNPSRGIFQLKSLMHTTDAYIFELIDVNAKIIFTKNDYFDNGNIEEFRVSDLKAGVYMLKIYNQNTKKTEYKKVVIQS
jgi:hypothetical protein